jgi:hypothetical protein
MGWLLSLGGAFLILVVSPLISAAIHVKSADKEASITASTLVFPRGTLTAPATRAQQSWAMSKIGHATIGRHLPPTHFAAAAAWWECWLTASTARKIEADR